MHNENSKCEVAAVGLLIKTICYEDLRVARTHNAVAMRALPRWLRKLDQGLRPLDWRVKSGWAALHTAALRGGNAAGFRSRYSIDPDSLEVRIDQYRSLVLDIPRRIGFNDEILEKAWTRAATQIGKLLATKVREQDSTRDARDIVSIRQLLGDTHHELTRAFPSIQFSVATPFDALRSAYSALRLGRAARTVRLVELYCLAWIGIAAQGILKMRHCELCFRWAIPGHDHCYEHSQSKEASGTAQEKSLRYHHLPRTSS